MLRVVMARALLALLIASVACTMRDPLAADAGTDAGPWGGRTPQFFRQNVVNKIDIVWVIDNSTSMEQEQANYTRRFPTFMNVLKSLPMGLPDVHLGVITSSLGAGRFENVPSCPKDGDRGVFQSKPRGKGGTCTAVPDGSYIVSEYFGTRNNFKGDISDVFSCIAEVGTEGCDFEHQLASVARALGANLGGWTGGAPSENAGFLRDDALLAVIFLTDEDDCSAPVDGDLFDPGQTSVSDPLGPFSSFRCAEFGHLCDGRRIPRTPQKGLAACHSAEDGRLIRVAEFVSFFKALKPDPDQLFVSVIAAPPMPYAVRLDKNGNPALAASCVDMNGEGFPAVRLEEFARAFGKSGGFWTICRPNRAPVMDAIAKEVGRRLGAQCLDAIPADIDATTTGLQPSCDVFDQTKTVAGVASTAILACEIGGPTPCWKLVFNNRDCTKSGYELKVDRGAVPAPPGTVTGICCETKL